MRLTHRVLFLILGTLVVNSSRAQQAVTVRQINEIPQSQIDQLIALGDGVAPGDVNNCGSLIYNDLCGSEVTFTAVVLSDPLNSGLSSINSEGYPGRIHIFVRDVASDTEGPEYQGIQIVDGGNLGFDGLVVGDVVQITGRVAPFNTTMQVSPTTAPVVVGSRDPLTDPIFAPIVVTTADLNASAGSGDAIRTNWANLGKYRGNYVRFEGASAVTRTLGARADWNWSSDNGTTSVSLYDASLRFRNDRSDYPSNFNTRTDNYVPPIPSATVNAQGFVTFNGGTSSDPYSLGVPNGMVLAVNPMEDTDVEVVDLPKGNLPERPILASVFNDGVLMTALEPGGVGAQIYCASLSYGPDIEDIAAGMWSACAEGLDPSITTTDLISDSSGRIWMTTWGGSGLYYSNDHGMTWIDAKVDLTGGLGRAPDGRPDGFAQIFSITEDILGTLFLSVNEGSVYRSFDRGATWQKAKSLPLISMSTSFKLKPDPTLPGTLYAYSQGEGIFVTTDFGETWRTPIAQGLRSKFINDIETDSISGYLLAATRTGLFGSANGGDAWIDLNAGFLETTAEPNVLKLEETASGFFIALEDYGIWHSSEILSGTATSTSLDSGTPTELFTHDAAVFALLEDGSARRAIPNVIRVEFPTIRSTVGQTVSVPLNLVGVENTSGFNSFSFDIVSSSPAVRFTGATKSGSVIPGNWTFGSRATSNGDANDRVAAFGSSTNKIASSGILAFLHFQMGAVEGEVSVQLQNFALQLGSDEVASLPRPPITSVELLCTPVANADTYAVRKGATLVVTKSRGLLANDSDADSDKLTASIQSDPLHGEVALNADGSFTYQHDGSDSATDSFTYELSDGTLTSSGTVSITIVPVSNEGIASSLAFAWNVPVSEDPHRPFPENHSGVRTVAGPYDLDGDGRKEVLVSDYTGGGRVHVLENQGDDVWNHVYSTPWLDNYSGTGNARVVAGGDMDSDGRGEIYFFSGATGTGSTAFNTPFANPAYPPGLYVFEFTGTDNDYGTAPTTIYEMPTNRPDRWQQEQLIVKDIDKDGRAEMLFGNNGSSSIHDNWWIFSVNGDIGSGIEEWITEAYISSRNNIVDPVNRGGGSPYGIVAADLDGNGITELVMSAWNNLSITLGQVIGKDTYHFPDGSLAPNYAQLSTSDHVSLFGLNVADIDGDGNDEVFGSVLQTGDIYVVNYDPGEPTDRITEGNFRYPVVTGLSSQALATGDFDGDGKMELIGPGTSYSAEQFDANLAPNWINFVNYIGGPNSNPEDPANYSDLVPFYFPNELGDDFDLVIRDSAGVITQFRENGATGPQYATKFAYLGDTDGDGKNEIAVGFQGQNDSLYTYRETFNPADSTYARVVISAEPNPARTFLRILESSSIASNRPPQINWSVSAVEGTAPLELTIDAGASSDPDGDAIAITWGINTVPGSSCSVGSNSKVFECTLQEGSYHITAIASDGVNQSTRSVDVVVSAPPPAEWNFDLQILQGAANVTLRFGQKAQATALFDHGMDLLAPPPPPGGVLDARFTGGTDHLLNDFRPVGTETLWALQLQHASGADMAISWDPSAVPENSSLTISDPINGSILSADMATVSTITVPSGLTGLVIRYASIVSRDVDHAAGWNMVGTPLAKIKESYRDLFSSSVEGTMFAYESGYTSVSSGLFAEGRGYWLRLNNAETVTFQGVSQRAVTWNLAAGWNMVAGPDCLVPRADIENLSGITSSTLFGYNGGYFLADGASPGKAYWVRASAPSQVSVSCPSGSGKMDSGISPSESIDALTRSLGDEYFQFAISFSTDNQESAVHLTAGLSPQASDAYDDGLDQFAPPKAPSTTFDARFVGESDAFLTDVRSSAENLPVTWEIVFSASDSTDITLTWNPAELQDHGNYRLQGGLGLADVDMTEVDELIIESGSTLASTGRLWMTFSTESGTPDEAGLPTAFELSPIYPNPFNPVATVAYSLPESSTVSLILFDILGRQVQSLVTLQRQSAGNHHVVLDGSNLASGVYVVRMVAGSFVSSQHVVLLK